MDDPGPMAHQAPSHALTDAGAGAGSVGVPGQAPKPSVHSERSQVMKAVTALGTWDA
jgi:hypothetical protein